MTRKIFLFLFAVVFCKVYAQELPQIIPPSPNAASLGQYVEVPVSHYTGLPNINVPLYTISQGNIQVPIGLSYHARGIKVGDIASNYGIGWSMNAGGVVSRQIRGNEDDYYNRGYLSQNYFDSFDNPTTRLAAHNADLLGNWDPTPDQFMFNFSGYSGKFIFDRDTNKPLLQSFDDLKIETVGNVTTNIEGFIITDPKGIKYYFGKSQNGSVTYTDYDHTLENHTYTVASGHAYSSQPSTSKTTSWYLIEIIDIDGNKVSFTYDDDDNNDNGSGIKPETYRTSEETAEKVGTTFVKTARFSKVKIHQKRIKKIDFDAGEVNFYYTIARQDLNHSNALGRVEVSNKKGQRVKKYLFDYFYTEASSSPNVIPFLNNQIAARKRLFLSSIKEENNNSSTVEHLPPYQFTYNSTVLPSRFSTSRDKWGYYNGKNNGKFNVFADDVYQIAGTAIDTVKSQAGLLTKIQYPTGGWSEYEYESNRAVFPEHLKDQIAFIQNNPIVNKSVVIDKDPIFYNTTTKEYTIPFTVGPNLVISNANNTGTVLTFVELNSPECTNVENNTCPYKVRIYNTNNTVQSILHKTSVNTLITPGDYILKVIPNDPNSEDPNDFENGFGVLLEWKESIENENEVIYTGGSRIKKITLHEGNGQTIVKSYEYKDSAGETSGRVFSMPSYYGYEQKEFSGGVMLRTLQHVTFKPANTLTNEQGNHGGYAFVTEYLGDKNNNIGKTEYEFTAFYNSGNYYRLPFHLPTDNEWLRGKPTYIRAFKNNNGSYELVSKTKNTYEYGGVMEGYPELMQPEFDANGNIPPNTSARNFIELARFNSVFQSPPGQFDPLDAHNNYTIYYLNAGAAKLKKTETTQYFGSEEITNTTEHFYTYDHHYQIKYTQNINSRGEKTYSEFIYPQDAPNTNSIIDKLVDQNRFDLLETTIYKGFVTDLSGPNPTTTLSKQKTEYISAATNIVVPGKVQVAKGTTTLQDRVLYNYYTDGKVRDVRKKDGGYTVYLWGYNKELPIAKIENATYAQVESAIGTLNGSYNTLAEIQGISNSDNDATQGFSGNEGTLRKALDDLRNVLPNAMVTSITYDPLIGVTSITDPRGQTIYYEYDQFNRLKEVKDVDGKILSHNEYNYKN